MSLVVDPTLREAIDAVLDERLAALHTSFPARVLRYDVEGQTVDVQPALRREQPTGGAGEPFSFEALPVLYAVPILWQRGGGFAVTFPIAAGDWVLVHCAEQATAPWRLRGQAPSPAGLNDPHGLNGCVAIPGWFPDVKRLEDVSATDYELRRDSGEVLLRAKPGGELELGGAGASLVALAEHVDDELDAIAAAFWTFSPGSGGASFPDSYTRAPAASVAAQKVKAR